MKTLQHHVHNTPNSTLTTKLGSHNIASISHLYLQWMVLEARKLSKRLRTDEDFVAAVSVGDGNGYESATSVVDALDSLGYDEAAREVYGVTYPEWKKRHQRKATDEQL